MKTKLKKWLKPILFIAGGALAGLVIHQYAGCSTGTCALVASPYTAIVYMGLVGWLLSLVFGKEDSCQCNT